MDAVLYTRLLLTHVRGLLGEGVLISGRLEMIHCSALG